MGAARLEGAQVWVWGLERTYDSRLSGGWGWILFLLPPENAGANSLDSFETPKSPGSISKAPELGNENIRKYPRFINEETLLAQSGSVIRPGSLVFVCQSATQPTSSCFQSLAGGSDLVPPVPNSSSPLPASPQPSHGQGSLPLESQSPGTDRHLVSSLPRPPRHPAYLMAAALMGNNRKFCKWIRRVSRHSLHPQPT